MIKDEIRNETSPDRLDLGKEKTDVLYNRSVESAKQFLPTLDMSRTILYGKKKTRKQIKQLLISIIFMSLCAVIGLDNCENGQRAAVPLHSYFSILVAVAAIIWISILIDAMPKGPAVLLTIVASFAVLFVPLYIGANMIRPNNPILAGVTTVIGLSICTVFAYIFYDRHSDDFKRILHRKN